MEWTLAQALALVALVAVASSARATRTAHPVTLPAPLPGAAAHPTTRPSQAVCVAHESWKKDCNDCICSEAGLPVCTARTCGTPPAVCVDGEVWKKDCNTCRCVGGRSVCTLKACTGDSSSSEESGEQRCTPGSTWRKGCNSCSCTPGGLAVCTMIKCVSRRDVGEAGPQDLPQRRCTPGDDTWREDCNSCRCTPSGIPACTKMRCIKPTPPPEAR